MAAFGNLIRGTVAIIALIILIGATALNPIVTGWIGGYVSNEHTLEKGRDEAREANFRVICTDYFNSSLLERWTSTRHMQNGWCEDYKDRL